MDDCKNYTIYAGIDVGKSFHHICALDQNGIKVIDKQIDQDEAEIRKVFGELLKYGEVLITVDLRHNVGTFCVAIAKDMNIDIKYLTGYQMRQLAKVYYASSKTDAIDAFYIAKAGLSYQDILNPIPTLSTNDTKLRLYLGQDDDLVEDITRKINRLRGLLFEISPAFERVFKGKRITSNSALTLLEKYPNPLSFTKAGKSNVQKFAKKHQLRAKTIIEDIFEACSQQTIKHIALEDISQMVQQIVSDLIELNKRRALLQEKIEEIALQNEDCLIVSSIDGIGIQSAAKIMLAIGNISNFESASKLAKYAGCVPRVSQSGTSINKVTYCKGGNDLLRTTLHQIAFCTTSHNKAFKELYNRKNPKNGNQKGNRHKRALGHVKKKLCILIFALLKNKEMYSEKKHKLITVA